MSYSSTPDNELDNLQAMQMHKSCKGVTVNLWGEEAEMERQGNGEQGDMGRGGGKEHEGAF